MNTQPGFTDSPWNGLLQHLHQELQSLKKNVRHYETQIRQLHMDNEKLREQDRKREEEIRKLGEQVETLTGMLNDSVEPPSPSRTESTTEFPFKLCINRGRDDTVSPTTWPISKSSWYQVKEATESTASAPRIAVPAHRFPQVEDSAVATLEPLIGFVGVITEAFQQMLHVASTLNGELSPQTRHRLKALFDELTGLPDSAKQLTQQWSATKAVEEAAMRWTQRFFSMKQELATPQPQAQEFLPLSVQLKKTWSLIKQQFLVWHIAIIDQIGFPFDPSVHLALSSDSQSSGCHVVQILEVGFQRTADAPKGAGVVLDKARVHRGD